MQYLCWWRCWNRCYRSIKEAGKYAIGVDRDQSYLAPENVLTSAIKRVDVGIFETVKEFVEGKFQGGTNSLWFKRRCSRNT